MFVVNFSHYHTKSPETKQNGLCYYAQQQVESFVAIMWSYGLCLHNSRTVGYHQCGVHLKQAFVVSLHNARKVVVLRYRFIRFLLFNGFFYFSCIS